MNQPPYPLMHLQDPGSSTLDYDATLTYCGLANVDAAKEYYQRTLDSRFYARHPGYLPRILCLMGVILAYVGESERAVELLGLAFTRLNPHLDDWIVQWPLLARLRVELEAKLGAEAYTSAWERGKTLDLEMIARALLTRWGITVDGVVPLPAPALALAAALSRRELEILRLIAAGLSNEQIAAQLYLTQGTIKWHASHIYGKLAVGSRTQAIARARELKLLG